MKHNSFSGQAGEPLPPDHLQDFEILLVTGYHNLPDDSIKAAQLPWKSSGKFLSTLHKIQKQQAKLPAVFGTEQSYSWIAL